MSAFQQAVETHVERYAGEVAFRYEGLLVIPAKGKRASHIVMTCGMSERPMPGADPQWERAELCISLPREWPLEAEKWQEDEWGWPIREVLRLREFPFQHNTWFGFGHTIPNGDPPQPLAPTTTQCCSFLLPPLEFPEHFARIRLKEDTIINFWNIVPIDAEELQHKITQGAPALLRTFGFRGVSDIVNPNRQSAIRAQVSMAPGGWFDKQK